MQTSSQFLNSLGSDHIQPSQLSEFEHLVCAIPDLQARRDAVHYLLRIVRLDPDQVVLLARWRAVQEDLDLQLALKRHIRSQEYSASQQAEQMRLASKWAVASDLVKALFVLVPPMG
jgi:hypothetical protein